MNDLPAETPRSPAVSSSPSSLAERVRGILSTKNLTIYSVAAESRRRHPNEPSYHLPHNFYFHLQSAGITPTLHQVSSLSELTSYRFADWLRVFGFHLDDVARAEATLPRQRTALLDGRVQETDVQVPWVRDRLRRSPLSPVAPLSLFLEPTGKLLASALPFPVGSSRFYYAKIGQQDAFAFPDIAPGDIVRANPILPARCATQAEGLDPTSVFLIEHGCGVCCSRLHFKGRDRIVLLPTQLPFANVEFAIGSEARILGVVDFEFRPLLPLKRQAIPPCLVPDVAPDLARQWIPTSLETKRPSRPAQMLRDARQRAVLSLRNASDLSRHVAQTLGDARYIISQGSLSDYEANDRPPRHIHKLFTLCSLYALALPELLRAYGFDPTAGTAPISTEWITGLDGVVSSTPEPPPATEFLSDTLQRFGELPFFLHGSIARLSGLPGICLNDVFWIGGETKPMHPALTGGLFALVHRRKTTPPAYLRKGLWERPLYLVLRRDGSYFLANCTLEENMIVVHPHGQAFIPQERLRNRVDAEVVGEVGALVRSLSPAA